MQNLDGNVEHMEDDVPQSQMGEAYKQWNNELMFEVVQATSQSVSHRWSRAQFTNLCSHQRY